MCAFFCFSLYTLSFCIRTEWENIPFQLLLSLLRDLFCNYLVSKVIHKALGVIQCLLFNSRQVVSHSYCSVFSNVFSPIASKLELFLLVE